MEQLPTLAEQYFERLIAAERNEFGLRNTISTLQERLSWHTDCAPPDDTAQAQAAEQTKKLLPNTDR